MNPFRRSIRKLYTRFSASSREKKFKLFSRLFELDDSTLVLDVGFGKRFAHQYILEDYLPTEVCIIAGEIDEQVVRKTASLYPHVLPLVFDGCHLPFRDKSVDVVYSNAVIEHIGDRAQQKLFADEVGRVGKAWFVTTPNLWFPVDTHTSLPFVHWLPKRWRLAAFRSVGRRGDLVLLTKGQLQTLFPDSQVVQLRTTIFPEVLIAFRTRASD